MEQVSPRERTVIIPLNFYRKVAKELKNTLKNLLMQENGLKKRKKKMEMT